MFRTLFALVTLGATTLCSAQMMKPSPGSSKPGSTKLSYSSVNVDGSYVALTFDDGPHATNTPRLLDILAKRNIKVTFFVLGECAQANPEILKREHAEGHDIANHSWSHPNLGKMSDEAVRSQLQRTHDLVAQIAGEKMKLMRPPYGSFSDRQKKWVQGAFGYKVILWAVDPLDWKRPGPSVVAHRIISETKPGNIILMHDIHGQSIDAVPQVLDGLQAKGYKFVTVSQLLAMEQPAKPKTAQPVKAVPDKANGSVTVVPVSTATPSVSEPTTAAKPAHPLPSAPATPPKKNDLPDSL